MTYPISDDRRPAVERALMRSFGTTELDAIAPLAGGMSGASIFRIRVGGIAYLMRVEGARDALRDPDRWYGCMAAAAEACLAPRVRHACAADGVVIMDLVEQRSLALDYPGSRRDLLVELGQAARALHAMAPFPPLVDYLDAMEQLIGQFQTSGLFPATATEAHLEAYRALAMVYRRLRPEPAPSHNDLNPGNILYDGRRLWLIDWESAFQADRWVDVACLANWFCGDETEAGALLATYLGAAPTEAQSARLYLARQINHVFYAMVFLNMAAAGRPGIEAASGWPAAPPLADFHRRLSEGEAVFASWEGRLGYGQARLDAALENIGGERFEAAARLAA
jgi:aminoglycoside phosphotransferase (APT) family kinase protein